MQKLFLFIRLGCSGIPDRISNLFRLDILSVWRAAEQLESVRPWLRQHAIRHVPAYYILWKSKQRQTSRLDLIWWFTNRTRITTVVSLNEPKRKFLNQAWLMAVGWFRLSEKWSFHQENSCRFRMDHCREKTYTSFSKCAQLNKSQLARVSESVSPWWLTKERVGLNRCSRPNKVSSDFN